MKALIDADIIVFRCGFAAERTKWHLSIPEQDYLHVFEYKKEADAELDKRLPGIYSRKEGEDFLLWPEVELEPVSHAYQNVKTLIKRCLDTCQCNEFDVELLMSGSTNFRYDVAVTRPYKGNRDNVRRPTYEREIKDYIIKNYPTIIADGCEADDLMGIKQTQYGPEESVIITLDKDLDQVPGFKYNFLRDTKYNISPELAYYNLHMQILTGDSTDNIPGLPGIGPGKAAKALHGLETERKQMEEVARMYQMHSGKEDWLTYMTEQARLVFIQREHGQVWEPPEYLNEQPMMEVKEYSLYGD